MMPIWTGTIMVPRITSSSALRPRKRSLAKANPASELNSITDSATTPEASAELASPRAKCAGSVANSRWKFSGRLPPGSSGGGTSPTTSLVRVATTSIQ
jgi:hypothetical protein